MELSENRTKENKESIENDDQLTGSVNIESLIGLLLKNLECASTYKDVLEKRCAWLQELLEPWALPNRRNESKESVQIVQACSCGDVKEKEIVEVAERKQLEDINQTLDKAQQVWKKYVLDNKRNLPKSRSDTVSCVKREPLLTSRKQDLNAAKSEVAFSESKLNKECESTERKLSTTKVLLPQISPNAALFGPPQLSAKSTRSSNTFLTTYQRDFAAKARGRQRSGSKSRVQSRCDPESPKPSSSKFGKKLQSPESNSRLNAVPRKSQMPPLTRKRSCNLVLDSNGKVDMKALDNLLKSVSHGASVEGNESSREERLGDVAAPVCEVSKPCPVHNPSSESRASGSSSSTSTNAKEAVNAVGLPTEVVKPVRLCQKAMNKLSGDLQQSECPEALKFLDKLYVMQTNQFEDAPDSPLMDCLFEFLQLNRIFIDSLRNAEANGENCSVSRETKRKLKGLEKKWEMILILMAKVIPPSSSRPGGRSEAEETTAARFMDLNWKVPDGDESSNCPRYSDASEWKQFQHLVWERRLLELREDVCNVLLNDIVPQLRRLDTGHPMLPCYYKAVYTLSNFPDLGVPALIKSDNLLES